MNGFMIPPIPHGTDRDSQHPLGFLPLLKIASKHQSLKIFKVAPQGPMVVDVHPNCFDTQGIKHGDGRDMYCPLPRFTRGHLRITVKTINTLQLWPFISYKYL